MNARPLLLRGLRCWSEGRSWRGDLRLRQGRIREVGEALVPQGGERVLELEGYLALPGLINAHDHLGLDLMPALGRPPYRSFYDWAEEIYRPEESPLREILAVPEAERLLWGGWRNLCSGVTTVVHHDPYRRLLRRGFPLRVPRVAWSHSLGYGESLRRDHRRAGRRPWVVHAAEGTDERARGEVDRLESLGLLAPRTLLVHGIGITSSQEELLARRGAGLIWCPASNLRLYGATAKIDRLRAGIPVALGTDSTLSGSSSLFDELRSGLSTGLVPGSELVTMVTHGAADLLGSSRGEGRLQKGGVADLILLEDRGESVAERLLEAEPETLELVLVAGEARLASPALAAELGLGSPGARISGRPRWIAGDLARLRDRIASIAGHEVLSGNSTWSWLGV